MTDYTYNNYFNPLDYDYFRPWHMSAQSAYEVQRQNNFSVYIDMASSSRAVSSKNSFGNSSDSSSDLIALAVESCPLPDISNPTIELAYQNSKVKVAGQAEFGDIELTVKDFITTDIEKILWDWRLQVYNPQTGQIGWAEHYKKNGYISQYAPDGTHERSWRLVGLWPQNLGLGELGYENSDKKTISMTLAVDFAWLLGRQWQTGSGKKGRINDNTDVPTGSMSSDKLYSIDSGSNYAIVNSNSTAATVSGESYWSGFGSSASTGSNTYTTVVTTSETSTSTVSGGGI